jgi:hypothetical protein
LVFAEISQSASAVNWHGGGCCKRRNFRFGKTADEPLWVNFGDPLSKLINDKIHGALESGF